MINRIFAKSNVFTSVLTLLKKQKKSFFPPFLRKTSRSIGLKNKSSLSTLSCSSLKNGLRSRKQISINAPIKITKVIATAFSSPFSAICLFPLSRLLTSVISWLPFKGGFMKIYASFLIPFSNMLLQTVLLPIIPCFLSPLRKPNATIGVP